MRRHVLTDLAFALATVALSSVPASACSWRGCSGYDYYAPRVYGYYPPPPIYGYAPPPAYGYYPPAPVYGYAPPPAYGYYPPASVYGNAPAPAYGYAYGRPRPEYFPTGSTAWWRAMDYEGRGGHGRSN